MKRDPDYFGDQELDLIYIAKRLQEALDVEERFTERGIDYHVEPDEFTGGVIFRRVRIGAFFYVQPDDNDRARHILIENGYRPMEGPTD